MPVSFFIMTIRGLVCGVLLLAGTGVAAGAQDVRYQFAQVHMGMEVELVLYAQEASLARAAAAAAFDRIRMLEDTMSDYRDESEVRRLARRPGEWVPVSSDLYRVLGQALTLAERSEGAFDPTIGLLAGLWREARRSGIPPPEDAVRSARVRTGWRLVQLDSVARAVRLLRPGMALDLGGIAKGYILDRALEAVREAGVGRVLIVAGGDIVAGDAPPGREGWRIEAEGTSPAFAARAATLANAALSTSGASEQFVEIGGVRYSHVLDPRTGRPLTDGRRVHVIAGEGALADGLATAASVLSPGDLPRMLDHYPGVEVEVVPASADSSSRPGSRPSLSAPSSGRSPPR